MNEDLQHNLMASEKGTEEVVKNICNNQALQNVWSGLFLIHEEVGGVLGKIAC